MLSRLIGEDIELVTALDPALAPVEADVGQIEQVLMNLVVNARDAMPQGGTVTISTVNIGANGRPPSVLLSVADTGCGMDAGNGTTFRILPPAAQKTVENGAANGAHGETSGSV